MSQKPTTRFSDRVQDYIRYRPSYPAEVVETLRFECGLTKQSAIADIGSGTGILTKLILQQGHACWAVEPNDKMRAAAETALSKAPGFKSVAGTAEDTNLASKSVDLIVAAQAFHWFDSNACRKKFQRILKPHGWIALIWNERRVDETRFLREYEQLLLTHSTDYAQVDHRNIDNAALARFFGHDQFGPRVFDNSQQFDLKALIGRCFSSSYTPNDGEPGHEELKAALEDLFERRNEDGFVEFIYDTNVYFGRFQD